MEIDRDEKWEENGVKSVNMIKLDNIPEWLLMEVLIRLPVKLVFRSKLVCKEWLSTISDPSFMLMYVSRASLFPKLQPWTFISGLMHVDNSQYFDIQSMVLKSPSLHVLPCPCTHHPNGKRYMILEVSSGLVLYGLCIEMGDRFNYIDNYSICNPITSQWIDLPPHSRPFRFASKGFVTRVEGGILTSYRVVRLNVLLRRTNIIKFEVFSSEIGEWKDFDVHIDLKVQFAWPGRPTFLNGILHWITREHVILAYDPYHPENVHIIALPIDIHIASTNNALPSFYDVYVHQGRLSYFEMADLSIRPHGFSRISIWVLNDYSTGDWSLQHRIHSSEILYDGILSGQNLSLKPINFHPFDSDVLYLGCNNMIVSYNIKTRKLEAHDSEDSYKSRPCWWSVFLLVIPLWPIYVPPPSFGITEV